MLVVCEWPLVFDTASNTRHVVSVLVTLEACEVNGERGGTTAGAGSVGTAACRPEPGQRSAVRRVPAVLPGRGQGPGEVRDAACPRGRRGAGDRRGGGSWLLPGRVLSGRRSVRGGRHERPGGRASGPARTAQADPGDRRRSSPPRTRTCRAPRSPRRSPPSSGCCCTGAPSSGPGGNEDVLAGGRSGPGRLRDAAPGRAGRRRDVEHRRWPASRGVAWPA